MTVRFHYDHNVPNALYLCDFGGAHGRQVYTNPTDLINDITKILSDCGLINKEDGYFIYGVTNSGQAPQRKMLESIGFTSTTIGHLVQHSITDKEFSTAAALAIEAAKKEEARKAAELKKAEEERIARDIKDGRKPGELRVGDVVVYTGHSPAQQQHNPYVIVGVDVDADSVAYTQASQFGYYSLSYLASNRAGSMEAKRWLRADPSLEQEVIKRYPSIRPIEEKKETVKMKMANLSAKEAMKRSSVKKAS